MGIIYRATNKIDGKTYIGYTSSWPLRKKTHEKLAGKDNGYFHNALSKYGADNFEWFIIDTDAKLADEKMYIEEYGSYWETGKGYNLTRGGEGKLGYVTSDETRSKISEAHKGKKCTPKQLEILRENAMRMKKIGHTEEAKAKISASHKGKTLSDEHRKNISLNHAAHRETGVYYQSQEYKEKMSKATKGKKRTPEQRERIRLGALKRYGKGSNK
jgi:group I intron endonuclease